MFNHLTASSQSTKDAIKFYEVKISDLGANLKDLESIVQGKSNNLRVVEDGMHPRTPNIKTIYIDPRLSTVLRQKVISSSAAQKA